MLTPLHGPIEDTSAANLSLALGLDRQPAHAVLPLDLGGVRLELRVLGRSHQVVLEVGAHSDGANVTQVSEVVASLPRRRGGLPHDEAHDMAGLAYRFAAETLTLAPRDFSTYARALRAEVACGRSGIVGCQPDNPEAFTALRARRREAEVCWQTWHAYPRTGEIVVTRSTVTLPACL